MSQPERISWPSRSVLIDVGWALFALANLGAILMLPRWETVPFHFIWVSLTLVYGFRVWQPRSMYGTLLIVFVATGSLILVDVVRQMQPPDELAEVPLMTVMFLAMVWHARRRLGLIGELRRVSEDNLALLDRERRFIQDASHELRTPITAALGHAELLQHVVVGEPLALDVQVVVDELSRLRRLADRLLAMAAAEHENFLFIADVELEPLMLQALQRWTPTPRRWLLSRLDEATVLADADRLTLAIDALIENAVGHTKPGESIELSLVRSAGEVTISVADTGEGIGPEDLNKIFARFGRGVFAGRGGGLGLGLSIVHTVAVAHGGRVSVESAIGAGSTFRLALPVQSPVASSVVLEGAG